MKFKDARRGDLVQFTGGHQLPGEVFKMFIKRGRHSCQSISNHFKSTHGHYGYKCEPTYVYASPDVEVTIVKEKYDVEQYKTDGPSSMSSGIKLGGHSQGNDNTTGLQDGSGHRGADTGAGGTGQDTAGVSESSARLAAYADDIQAGIRHGSVLGRRLWQWCTTNH